MASRRLIDLHPDLLPLVNSFLAKCKASRLDILITCTYRSNEEQAVEYAKGRTNTLAKTTNAKPGQSKHNFTIEGKPAAKAFDIVPMENGKCIWDTKHPAWQTAGSIGISLGLEWAGNWISFKEYPHFQLPD